MKKLAQELAPYQHVIWDMNGTLIDDADLCVQAVNPLLKEHGLSVIDVETYRERFRFPVMDYYHDIGFRVTEDQFEEMSHRFHARYLDLLPTARVFSGTHELLGTLKETGKTLSILSAAWQPDLEKVVRFFGIDHYFDHFFGLNHRKADSKVQRGYELLKITGSKTNETVLLGDTLHDLEVGEALGVDVFLLTGGHMSEERLQHPRAKIFKRD